jgi:hypothetical protein
MLRLYEPGAALDALARARFEATVSDAYGASSRSRPGAGRTVVIARPATLP